MCTYAFGQTKYAVQHLTTSFLIGENFIMAPLFALAVIVAFASSFVPGGLSAEDSCNPLSSVSSAGSLFKKSPSGLSIFRDIQFAVNVRLKDIRRWMRPIVSDELIVNARRIGRTDY